MAFRVITQVAYLMPRFHAKDAGVNLVSAAIAHDLEA